MSQRRLLRSELWENEVLWTRAQVVLESGAALASGDCDTYSVHVFDTGDEGLLYAITGGTPSDVVKPYSTVGWTEDAIGYNVTLALGPELWSRVGGRGCRVVLTIAATVEGNINVVHVAELLSLNT